MKKSSAPSKESVVKIKRIEFDNKDYPALLMVYVECSMCDANAFFSEHDEHSTESLMMASGWSGELGDILCPKCDKLYSARTWNQYAYGYGYGGGRDYYDI